MNRILPLLFTLMCGALFAQNGKPKPHFKNSQTHETPRINWQGKASVPPAENPFNHTAPYFSQRPALQPKNSGLGTVNYIFAENGLPIMMEGKTAASAINTENQSLEQQALKYLSSLEPFQLQSPETEFVVKSVQTDEQGNRHIRMEQSWNGLPVWGGELIAHTQNGAFERVNGRYFPTPELQSSTPGINNTQAIEAVKAAIGKENVKENWDEEDLKLIDGQPFSAELLVFHPNDDLNAERLTWHIVAHPNVLRRIVYFVDAQSGKILSQYDNTCNLVGHRHHSGCSETPVETLPAAETTELCVDGPVTVSGQDLFSVNQSFTLGGWQKGSVYYLENTNKNMFSSTSVMPGNPVGVIVTLDGLNGSPENQNFNYDFVSSSSATFSNQKAAISAHFNAGKSYDYFLSKFSRNSIDGAKGNIISLVNISESDGSSMENAYWNGEAMFYGNGGSTFKPLARGLDVGGHEMTHGVVEKTANLVYQGESGALNESFADVFGALIDAGDWKIGEDVMQSGAGATALRDLSNPHNGVNSNSPWWQPNHMNERYTGTQDNGGVHINSGIVNFAFFKFATDAAVGTLKAEQVYYKALRDYLTKNSKFVDCRIAVIQAATDLYGTPVANAAANAFAAVGIGGSAPSGNYLGQLSPNPGTEFALCVTNNQQNLDLANASGTIIKTLYNQGVQSRPTITDAGQDVIFVNTADHIVLLSMNYGQNPPTATSSLLSSQPEWRQAAISKDGRFVAGLTNTQEPYIYIFDLISGAQEAYKLSNPTYSTGQSTGDVQYADVLEFDYSGTVLMYDAYNELTNTQGEDLGYWDIGFLEFWKNGNFVAPANAFISKAFSGIPERTGIGNPTFSKNSPFIIAFDFIDQTSVTTRNDVYGNNVETGDFDVIISNNGTLGWPNYNRVDNKLLYEVQPSSGVYNLRQQGLATSKIQASGGSAQFTTNHSWGVWYANGNRSLMVGATEAGGRNLSVGVSPNPVVDNAQIKLVVEKAVPAQVSVFNVYGQQLVSRNFDLSTGENLLDYDMSNLPAGAYVLKITAGDASGALKVLKQ
jgi:Zn-dependent metalloprotease